MAKKTWIFAFLMATFVALGLYMSLSFFAGPDLAALPNAADDSKMGSDQEPRTNAPEKPREIPTKEAEIRQLFNSKRFSEALALVESELKGVKDDALHRIYRDWLERQRWIIKTAYAWGFLEKQNCSAAMTVLEEIPEDKRPSLVLKGIGYCKFLSREWQEADAYLSKFMESRGKDRESMEMLARTKEAMGLYDEALELTRGLETLSDEGAAPLDIEPLQKSLRAKQDESLSQLSRSGAFFTLHYQPSVSADFLDQVAETLQKTATKLNLEFGIDYPEKSIDIYFHAQERFGEITHGPEWAAGVYDGQIRLPLAEGSGFTEAIARTIRHEITHALLSEMVGRRNLPTWFQEGFAQLSECESFCLGYKYISTPQKFLPAETFEQSFVKLSAREAGPAYRQSFYLVQLLRQYQKEANIKQMFSLLPGLESLSSQDVTMQAGMPFTQLYQSAKREWESQISLKENP